MPLLIGLLARVIVIAVLCLACAAGWVLVDAHRGIEAEGIRSAERAERVLRDFVWLGSETGDAKLEMPWWEKVASANVVAPGICLRLKTQTDETRRLCGEWSSVHDAAPSWFAWLYMNLFGPDRPILHTFMVQQRKVGDVIAETMPGPVMQQTWRQVLLVADVAAGTVVAVTLLAFVGLSLALRPTLSIIRGLKELGQGNLDYRLPAFRAVEFKVIGDAINDLAARLSDATAERTHLTQRLFQVQEDERRTLARELHDEFGQCLAATAALAASIEMGAGSERPDQAGDARSIGRYAARMMTRLKSALAILRPPDLDELGLEMSLRQLAARWNALSPGDRKIRVETAGELAGIPQSAALSIYRIAQECLTNAVRHGKPKNVMLSVKRTAAGPCGSVTLSAEDDGGGTPKVRASSSSFGLLGMKERVDALGGRLTIERGRAGFLVTAVLPLSEADRGGDAPDDARKSQGDAITLGSI